MRMLIVDNLQESGEEDDKKMMRIIHKKSQTVTQAHMCNYCNYTSPKRLDRSIGGLCEIWCFFSS